MLDGNPPPRRGAPGEDPVPVSTDWHDHGESSGSYVVLQGALTEQEATAGGGDQRLRPVRTPGRLIRSEQRTFGRRYVHQLTNLGLDPAVSLHVYTPRLTVMTTYAERYGFLHPTATQREGVTWSEPAGELSRLGRRRDPRASAAR